MSTETLMGFLTHGDDTVTVQDLEDALNTNAAFRARIEDKYGVSAELILNFVREQIEAQNASPYT